MRSWSLRPWISLAPGPDQQGRALLPRARRSEFRFPTEPPGSPSATRDGRRTVGASRPAGQQANRSRSTSTRRSWSGSPRSMWPRRRGWSAPGCRTRPRRASASPGSGRWARPPTRSLSWPTSWPIRGSSGWWSSPPPTPGGRSWICWRRGGCAGGWSMPTRSNRCRAAPRPTSWMPSGWPSSTSGGCCGACSSHPHRSAGCGTTPGCALSWSRSAPGTSSGWRSCWRTP